MQRSLIQYRNPKNYELVLEALKKADRMDLVGYDKHCLIRPKRSEAGKERSYSKTDGKQSANGRKKKKTIRNVHKKKTGGRKS